MRKYLVLNDIRQNESFIQLTPTSQGQAGERRRRLPSPSSRRRRSPPRNGLACLPLGCAILTHRFCHRAIFRNALLRRCVRLQHKFTSLFRPFEKVVSRAVSLQADQDADFLNFFQSRVELVKAADKKISDQAIEETGVLTEQDAETVAQTYARFVRDECQVG